MMIPVKLTRAHQVTLPKRLLERAGWLGQEYFVAELQDDALTFKPVAMTASQPVTNLAELRRHFARVGVTKRDVANAVAWARRPEQMTRRPRRTKR